VLAYVLTVLIAGRGDPSAWQYGWAISGALASCVLLVTGLVLVIVERTRVFGAGVLISIGIALVVGGGICVAVLNSLNA
jgi:hypothetical protein